MKNLVSFILSYCLVITSLSIPLNTFAQTAGSFNPNIQSECPNDSAWRWDAQRNRCVFKQSASEDREEFQECLDIDDSTEAGRQQKRDCIERNRDRMVEESGSDSEAADLKEQGGFLASLGSSVSLVYLIVMMVNGSAKFGDGACTSRKIFKYASIAGIAQDIYYKIFGGKKFDEIKDEYEKMFTEDYSEDSDGTFTMQIAAFKYLIDQQNAVESLAKQQATIYTILALGFLASLILASVEATVGSTPPAFTPTPCIAGAEGQDTENAKGEQQTNSDVDSAQAKVDSAQADVDTAQAKVDGMEPPAEGAEPSAEYKAAQDDLASKQKSLADANAALSSVVGAAAGPVFTNLLQTSWGIAILSGLMMTFYGILAKGAISEAKKAANRAKTVQRVKEQFETMYTSAGFCTSRDDLSNPQCYCFDSDGKRNPSRSNSQTCQNLWAAQDMNLFAEANNSEFQQGVKPPRKGCVTITQKFDPECKCRKMKSSDGSNACYQQAIPTQDFGQFAPASLLTDPMRQFANITNGGLGSGDVNGGVSNVTQAAKTRFKKQAIKQLDQALKKNGQPNYKNFSNGLARKLASIAKNLQGRGVGGAVVASGPASPPSNLEKAVEKHMANAELKKAFKGKRIAARRNGKRAGKRKMFEFNESAANAPKVVGDYMEKEYDYSKAQDDIVDRSDVSIWKILSNRYTRTGLERLFGGDKKSGQGL